MGNATRKLISISSVPIVSGLGALSEEIPHVEGKLADDLCELLTMRNGFYAFEGALHVFPTRTLGHEVGLRDWNDESDWRSEYDGMDSGLFFFAEDVFGGQFAISDGGIYTFDPETAETECIARSIEEWCDTLLNDYEVLTGYPLAAAWQRENGPLRAGHRLIPKVPFVAGGEFGLANLMVVEASKGMKLRGNLARQIRDLPDGAQIRYSVC